MANLSENKCLTCNGDYKCYKHRRFPAAIAVKYDVGSRIHVMKTDGSVHATLVYSVEEAEELILDLQRAIKAY